MSAGACRSARNRRHPLRVPGALALSLATWHGGRAAWIETKACLAQALVRHAWRETLAGGRDARPWPWADTRPVARLLVPGRDVETFVLAGASGRTLAFGPGHLDGTPQPGEPGNAVISGHRDTHFAFLRHLGRGDEIVVETPDGLEHRYVVAWTRVVDRRDVWVVADAGDTRLTLVTCYPFDAIRPGGPLRYVVVAKALSDEVSTADDGTTEEMIRSLGGRADARPLGGLAPSGARVSQSRSERRRRTSSA